MLLAIVGTLVATFITGGVLIWLGDLGLITQLTAAEAYLYGALISAVDPVATLSVFKKNGVPPLLFNLVFGESMLNDGVGELFDQIILLRRILRLLTYYCMFTCSYRVVHAVSRAHSEWHC